MFETANIILCDGDMGDQLFILDLQIGIFYVRGGIALVSYRALGRRSAQLFGELVNFYAERLVLLQE